MSEQVRVSSRKENGMGQKLCGRRNCLTLLLTGLISLLCVGLMLPSKSAAQGFFGPNNYDDCILQNMRGVTSDTAAGLVHRACLAKFPKKEPKLESSIDAGINSGKRNICVVFWDGKKFIKGLPGVYGYSTLEFAEYGVRSHDVAFPDEMISDFKKRKSEFDLSNPNDPFYDFWSRNHRQMDSLC